MKSNDRLASFAAALWAVGAFLILLPMADVVVRSHPLNIANLQWRFAFFGMLFTNNSGVILGLSACGIAAVVRQNYLTLRVMAVVSLVAAMFTLGGASLYALDTLQLRVLAPESQQGAVMRVALTSLVAALAGAGTYLALAIAGWRAGRPEPPGVRQVPLAEKPFIFSGPPRQPVEVVPADGEVKVRRKASPYPTGES